MGPKKKSLPNPIANRLSIQLNAGLLKLLPNAFDRETSRLYQQKAPSSSSRQLNTTPSQLTYNGRRMGHVDPELLLLLDFLFFEDQLNQAQTCVIANTCHPQGLVVHHTNVQRVYT